jgi:hypothetical protein
VQRPVAHTGCTCAGGDGINAIANGAAPDGADVGADASLCFYVCRPYAVAAGADIAQLGCDLIVPRRLMPATYVIHSLGLVLCKVRLQPWFAEAASPTD